MRDCAAPPARRYAGGFAPGPPEYFNQEEEQGIS